MPRKRNERPLFKNYIAKIKYIVPAYLLILLGQLIILWVVRWLFSIKFQLIDIYEDGWELLIPLVSSAIASMIWLRPRFKILSAKGNSERERRLFLVVSGLTIFWTISCSQKYFSTATGNMQVISTVYDISAERRTRYYKINSFAIEPNFSGIYTYVERGKRNTGLKLHLYYVVPIVRDSLQVAVDPKCWYGLHFDRVISSKLTDYDKEKEYKAFLDNCKWQIEKYRYYSLDHFEKIPNSRELNGFKNAIKVRLQKTIDKSYVILRPVDEKYENRNGSILIWIFVSFGVGFSLLLIALIFPGYNRFYHEEIMSKKK